MEKRFVLFLGLSLGILVGYSMLSRVFFPAPPVAEEAGDVAAADGDDQPADAEDTPKVEGSADKDSDETSTPSNETVAPSDAEPKAIDEPANEPANELANELANEPTKKSAQRWESIGSYAAGNSLLITFNSKGAAIERVEITSRDAKGRLKYRDLINKGGYLGDLALTPRREGGCTVNVVGEGTPAELAGIQVGDILLTADGQVLDGPIAFNQVLALKKPGESLALQMARPGTESSSDLSLSVTLDVRPLELIRPEPLQGDELRPHPLSYLLTLQEKTTRLPVDINLPAKANWAVNAIDERTIEFTLAIDGDAAKDLGVDGPLEIVKRYRLGTIDDLTDASVAYHVDMELEFRNGSDALRRISYSLDGPTGLPTEGWWYSAKIHPKMFYGAGARDVLIRSESERRLIGGPELYKNAKKHSDDREITLFAHDEPALDRTLQYVGVDTQYFIAALMPVSEDNAVFDRAEAFAIGDVTKQPKGHSRTTDVSFQLDSAPIVLKANATHKESFRIFLGPKDPDVLSTYELDDVIYYGWFGAISKVLKRILHFFYGIVGNFGIAIILLTVVVRGCMFPISRKAAKNAAMMQELAPEMRKLTEKYKEDMEKRAKAQQELFRRHNYNPFGGCWLMFLQLPIFLGLYRCIAVDIKLRQAALIPGIDWCSNLAGPDQLWYWKGILPNMLVSESGMLGPYLNVLPLITVSLFLVHQKLFTPPATDEQSQMQLKMMKYMTLFMGFMFFKVAAGLCLYFIASSLWGIAERKLVPKPKVKLSGGGGDVEDKVKGDKKPKWLPLKPKPSASDTVAEKKAARKKRNKGR